MFTGFSSGVSASQHALPGMTLAAGGRLKVNVDPVYTWTTEASAGRRVAIVSGGGAGHEPLHAGFLGAGGLDAAVPGEVFTSPHSRQIYEACRRVDRGHGVLQIVKNYTGDRINFAIAAERLRAEGIRAEEVVIDDDLASDGSEIGRRGTGATVVVEKILGAAADRGLDLDQLVELGRAVAASSRTIAAAFRSHTSPGSTEPAFVVEPGTVEYGIGIHGETAKETIAETDAATLVQRMVDDLLAALPTPTHGVIALVNGLGGVSNLALFHVLTEVNSHVAAKGVQLRSAVAGTYVSALDMAGFSLTLTVIEEAWLADWTAPHDTALPTPRLAVDVMPEGADATASTDVQEPSPWLRALVTDVLDLADDLNALDQRAGDGDFGTNMRGAMEASLVRASGADANFEADLRSMAQAFSNDVGGSSGPLLGLLFTHLATAVADGDQSASIAAGLRAGLEAVQRVGGAKPGDRTLVDALHPAAFDGTDPRQNLDESALAAAFDEARSTSDMVGRRGRSTYLGDRVIGAPDPGALAVVLMLAALEERISGQRREALRADVTAAIKA